MKRKVTVIKVLVWKKSEVNKKARSGTNCCMQIKVLIGETPWSVFLMLWLMQTLQNVSPLQLCQSSAPCGLGWCPAGFGGFFWQWNYNMLRALWKMTQKKSLNLLPPFILRHQTWNKPFVNSKRNSSMMHIVIMKMESSGSIILIILFNSVDGWSSVMMSEFRSD